MSDQRGSHPCVVAVLSQKGGTGKTTLSCALGAIADANGTPTAILDLDPQASAAKWHDLRKESGIETPPVYATPAARTEPVIQALGNDGAELIVADTAPHSGADVVTVAKLADHIIVPVQPSYPDIAAITRTLEIAEVSRTPATIVLNLALSHHPSTQDALAVIKTTGVQAAPVVMHRRIAHVTSFNAGLCAAEHDERGKAAAELRALTTWLETQNIIPRSRKGRKAA